MNNKKAIVTKLTKAAKNSRLSKNEISFHNHQLICDKILEFISEVM